MSGVQQQFLCTFGSATKKGLMLACRYPVALRYLQIEVEQSPVIQAVEWHNQHMLGGLKAGE